MQPDLAGRILSIRYPMDQALAATASRSWPSCCRCPYLPYHAEADSIGLKGIKVERSAQIEDA